MFSGNESSNPEKWQGRTVNLLEGNHPIPVFLGFKSQLRKRQKSSSFKQKKSGCQEMCPLPFCLRITIDYHKVFHPSGGNDTMIPWCYQLGPLACFLKKLDVETANGQWFPWYCPKVSKFIQPMIQPMSKSFSTVHVHFHVFFLNENTFFFELEKRRTSSWDWSLNIASKVNTSTG